VRLSLFGTTRAAIIHGDRLRSIWSSGHAQKIRDCCRDLSQCRSAVASEFTGSRRVGDALESEQGGCRVRLKHLRTAQQNSGMEAVSARIADASRELGSEHFASVMLATAISEAREDVDKLQQGVSRIIESLTFGPWMEAEVPEGFPEFAPVHHIEVKTLPDYRMARAKMTVTQLQVITEPSGSCSATFSETT